MFFYLYAVIDLFSRKLVAWEVHAREGGDEAAAFDGADLLARTPPPQQAAGAARRQRRGAKAYTLKSKLETLGITPSHSRPGVSDDNVHIEVWFRTCKYTPDYPPNGFKDIGQARQGVLKFVTWYNGPEYIRETTKTWAAKHGIEIAFI